ncbi:MAG: cytochrome C oxidase subunit IV family protein [Bacteriovoracaceae bacterium]
MAGHDTTHDHKHVSHKKEYFIIFVLLGALTAIEIWVADVKGLSKVGKGSALTFLAVGKAFLVAYYYMHLKEETKWTKFIAAVPIMAGLYATVLCLEAIYKPF